MQSIQSPGIAGTLFLSCILHLASCTPLCAADFTDWTWQSEVAFSGYTREAPLTNFPALLVLGPNVPGFDVRQAASPNGWDLRMTDATQANELNYEIEKWDSAGVSYVWVQVPLLTSNTSVWAFWGNSDEIDPQPYTTNGAVWSEGYAGVWHLADSGLNSVNGQSGAVFGTPLYVTGKVGPAMDFDGTNVYVDVGAGFSDFSDGITLVAWQRTETFNDWARVIDFGNGDAVDNILLTRISTGDGIRWRFYDTDGGTETHSLYGVYEFDRWQCWSATATGPGADAATSVIYLDGDPRTTRSGSTLPPVVTRTQNYLGKSNWPDDLFDGQMDEVRISTVARSADWVWAAWANMACDTAFNAYGEVMVANPNKPSVRNLSPANVTAGAAALNGELVSTGTSATELSVYWDTEDGAFDPSQWSATHTWPGAQGAGGYSHTAGGLSSNTLYWYRFSASNAAGRSWAPLAMPFMTGEVWIEATEPDASESGPVPGAFSVFRGTWATGAAMTVNYDVHGTAGNGVDYHALGGSVTFPVGATHAEIVVMPLRDGAGNDSDETVVLDLASGAYTIGAMNSATVTISDAVTRHVWTNSPNPAPPYNAWSNAAHTIQAALDEALDNDTVLVADGTYLLSMPVTVTKEVDVQSVSGAQATIVDGNGQVTSNRCFEVVAPNVTVEGFTISNGYAAAGSGGGVLVKGTGVVLRDCRILGNTADWSGGGVCFEQDGGAFMDHCRVAGNVAPSGGGLSLNVGDTTVENSMIVGNHATGWGAGGVYADARGYTSTLANCFIGGNSANDGGGVLFEAGTLVMRQCTISGNEAREEGGGVLLNNDATNLVVRNCVIYHNQAVWGPNHFTAEWVDGDFRTDASCTTPLPEGNGNTTNPPGLHSPYEPHLASNSVCVNAGENAYGWGAWDIDDEPRTNGVSVDMGCDEFWASGMTGTISAAIQAFPSNAVLTYPIEFTSLAEGRVSGYEWNFGDGSVVTDACVVSHTYAGTGLYEVVLTAWNNDGATAATVTVDIVEGYTNYVATGGGHVPPFTSWPTAATTIQDAVDANYAGGVTLVATGVYDRGGMVLGPTNRVAIVKPLTVMAADPDPTRTIIRGHFSTNGPGTRCAYLEEGATLAGFTLTGGGALDDGLSADRDGGGVLCFAGGVLSNCIVSGNASWSTGGGVACYLGGTILDCTIQENQCTNGSGGGIHLRGGGLASGCTVISNTSSTHGGGAYLIQGGVISNCTVSYNQSGYWGAGIYANGDCAIYSCTSSYNTAGASAGGLYLNNAAMARDCWIANNTATNGSWTAGGAYVSGGSVLLDSTILANDAHNGGGVYLSGEGSTASNCLIQSNDSTPYGEGEHGRSGYGGGVCLRSGALLVDSVVFANDAFWGGGVHVDRSGTINNCDILSNDALQDYWLGVGGYAAGVYLDEGGLVTNCFIAHQYARNSGGGVYMDAGTVVDSTIISNSSHAGGGLYVAGGRVAGCLIKDNVMRKNFSGGGVHIQQNALMEHCRIIGNQAPLFGEGGGVSIERDAVVRSCLIASNCAWKGGGVHSIRHGLEDCDIVDNVADWGGGIYSAYANFGGNYVRDCRVTGNVSTNEGGGIYFEGGTIDHVTFSSNWSMADGGGLYFETGVFRNCEFVLNDSWSDGGGVYAGGEGQIIDCTFVGNTASNRGGGIRLDAGGVVNGLLYSNAATWGGGAFLGGGALLGRLQNCTFADNHATLNGGGIYADDSGSIENTIAYHNTCPAGSSNVYNVGSGYQYEYSCAVPAVTGAGNITGDPQFAGGNDYRLAQTSPCVDAGINLVEVTKDLDGVSRPLDGKANGTNAHDMGCYEYVHAGADSDGDTMFDLWEVNHDLDPTHAADASVDSDGDGPPNKDEHIADTDPWDEESYFHLTGAEMTDAFEVTFVCTNSRVYSLQSSESWVTGHWSFMIGQTNVQGEADGEMSLIDTNELEQNMYRVTVEIP